MTQATVPTHRFRWPHLYLGLVALDITTVVAGLWVNQRLVDVQQATVRSALAANTLAAELDAIARTATPLATADLERTTARLAGDHAHDPLISEAVILLRAAGNAAPGESAAGVSQALTRELAGVRSALRLVHERDLQRRAQETATLRRLFHALIALALITTTVGVLCGLRQVRRLRRQEQQTAGVVAALEASELRKAAVIGASPDALIIMDEVGRITDFNPAAECIFAFRATEVIGQPAIDTIIPLPAREDYRRALARFRVSGDARHLGRRVETAGLRADGSEFPIELTVTPARIGAQTLFTAHVRDIAERKEQENALRRSNRELEQFAYVASHDLQEPLRMVSGYLALLEKRHRAALDDKGREFIAHAVDGAERMHALINGLLAYSRVDRGEAPQEAVDASAALAEALEYLRPNLVEAGAEVVSDPLPGVLGDRLQLVQLFQNLVGNAIKYRGEQAPRIHIAAERDGERWRITIRDNGIGIDPAYHERIFEIFQRLHTRAEYPGTGIGLAICKKIVERHGGRLWVESTKGQGSTFCFTLPESGSGRFRLRRARSAESSAALRIGLPQAREQVAQG